MQISLDTASASPDELTALIALCASLGGRLPSVGSACPVMPEVATITTPREAADALMRAESARVVAASDEQEDDGAEVDPAALDATGVPWDERIHSTPPRLTGTGAYRKKRGVSEVYFGQIHGELSEAAQGGNLGTGTMMNGEASQPSVIAENRTAPPPPSSSPVAPPPPVEGNATPAANAPTAPVPPSVLAASDGPRFADFPAFVQGVNAIRAPAIPYLELNNFAQALGVGGGFKDMKDRPDLWETFFGMAGGQ